MMDDEILSINTVTMRDGCTGEVLWETKCNDDILDTSRKTTITTRTSEEAGDAGGHELRVWLPKTILEKTVISREIKFSSKVEIENLRLVQIILLDGMPLEEWKFVFGFVIPNSVNTWQQVITSAPKVMDAERLSGHLTIETLFFNGDECMNKSKWRIFYE